MLTLFPTHPRLWNRAVPALTSDIKYRRLRKQQALTHDDTDENHNLLR